MTDQNIYQLYINQSKNVRVLKKYQNILIKDINVSISRSDQFSLTFKTKMLALLYSTVSEAQFIQILYTPKGLTWGEISIVKTKRNLTDKWAEIVKIGLAKIPDDSIDKPGVNDKLNEIINEIIDKPKTVRNKIAHGQWVVALNSANTQVNQDLTTQLENINVVKLTKLLKLHQLFCEIIRELLQSPSNHFSTKYIDNIEIYNNFIELSSTWTMENRKQRILNKKRV